ncbi:MAG: hypothetical protein KDD40_10225 [Bdellovibrionales bacterium]|nr:hypothetical protein [Bdellovibrionales bacterium]
MILLAELAVAKPAQKVRVAFLVFHDHKGKIVQLEPQGRFGHVAISYKNGWVHSYRGRRVEWVEDLSRFGHVALIVDVEQVPENIEDNLIEQFGKPYSLESEWEDPNATHCAKLVGQVLELAAKPTNWSTSFWQFNPLKKYPRRSLSPDDIYEYLMANNKINLCETLLLSQ